MDIDFSSSFTLVSLLVFLAMLWRITTRSKSEDDRCLNVFPGPRKLPLIGNLHQLLFAASQPGHRFLRDWSLKYGPIMYLKLGELNTLVITSPEIAKHVLKKHDATFANRSTRLLSEIVFYKNSDIIFSPYGDYWRQLRKICTTELLSTRRVQSLKPIREEEWLKTCSWIASKEGTSINLTEKVQVTTCDTVMRSTIGNATKEYESFISIVKEVADLGEGFYIGDLYPSIKLFNSIGGFKKRVERLFGQSDKLLNKIINDHKMSAGDGQRREDLVDVLLKFNKDEGHEFHLTIDNIKAVLQDIFSAGIETSSSTTDWAMAEMMRHPKVLEKAQDEVRRVFNEKGFVDESDFGELHYLKLVIKEAFRMHPPAPLHLRQNFETSEINGFKIPPKTRVIVNTWGIGRDPAYWKDPDSFIPERHVDKLVDYKGTNYDYLPFGSGKRICPGMTFGLANVELPLALFLYHFDWVLPNGKEPSMTEHFGLAVGRADPLYVIPTLRKPLSAE